MMLRSALLLTPFMASASFLLANQSSIGSNDGNISSAIRVPSITASAHLPTNSNDVDRSKSCVRTSTDPLSFINCGLGLCHAYFHASGPNDCPTFSQFWCEAYGEPKINKVDPLFYGMNASVKSYCLSIEEADYSSYQASQCGFWTAITSAPCCDQICSLKVASAQVLYWPTPAPMPNVTSVIGPDGFTYESPSVYVIYRGVSATGGCSDIGSTYASVTISYSQDELRTFSEGAFGVFDFADLHTNCTTSTAPPVASQPDCTDAPGASTCLSLLEKFQSDQDYQLKHCYPELEYPYKVRALEPEWANCESASDDRLYGVYDPPHALVSAKSMVPEPTLDPGTRLSAAPGSSILPSWPPATNSPSDTFPSKPSNPAIGNSGDLPPDQSQIGNTPASKSPQEVDPPAQDSSDKIRSSPTPQPPSDDQGTGFQDPSNHQATDQQAPSNGQSSDQQPHKNNQDSDPQRAGSQNLDAPIRDGPGSGKDQSKYGSDDQIENSQPLPDPSSPGDSGPTPTISWAGSTIKPGESSQYSIPHFGVLVPGGAPVISDGAVYLLAPSATAIFSNGHKAALAPVPTPQPAQAPVLTFGGFTYTANAASELIIAGQTLAPGHTISPSGTPIYLSPDGTVAAIGSGSSKQTLVTPVLSPPMPALTIDGSPHTADPFGNYLIAGERLTPGGTITASNTAISLAQDGAIALVGTETQLLRPAGVTPPPSLTFHGSLLTADGGGKFIIADQTLTPGGAITVSGTRISVAPDGSVAVVGTSSQLLTHGLMDTQRPVFTLDGTAYTADASSGFTINGQSLTRGGHISVNGTVVSYGVSGAEVVVGTSTQSVDIGTAEVPTITFDGKTYTADASGVFVIDGETLTRSGEITADGTRLSLDAGGRDVVVGVSSTEAVGVGGWVMSGFDGHGAARTSVVAFEGKGGRGMGRGWVGIQSVIGVVAVGVLAVAEGCL